MATAHLIRLIIIITVFPFIVHGFYESNSLELRQEIVQDQSELDLLILIFVSIILIYFLIKIGLPAALLSGTLIASGSTSNYSYCLLPVLTKHN